MTILTTEPLEDSAELLQIVRRLRACGGQPYFLNRGHQYRDQYGEIG